MIGNRLHTIDPKDIYKIYRSAILNCIAYGTGRTSLPGHALDYSTLLPSLESKLSVIKDDKQSEFIPSPNSKYVYGIERDKQRFRNALVKMLPETMYLLQNLPDGLFYSEAIEAFKSCCIDHFFVDEMSSHPHFHIQIDLPHEKTRLLVNEFINDLRQRLNTKSFKQSSRERKAACEKNLKSATRYVDALIATCRHLQVVEIILSYQKGSDTKYEIALDDLNRFLSKRRKNKSFDPLIGYLTKFEFGLETGIHLRTFLFLDGSKRQNGMDIHFAKEIGEYWKTVVTKGRGDYWYDKRFNLQDNSKLLLKYGIEVAENEIGLDYLKKTVRFLCLKDQFIRAKTGDIRQLRMGKMPDYSRPSNCTSKKSEQKSKKAAFRCKKLIPPKCTNSLFGSDINQASNPSPLYSESF